MRDQYDNQTPMGVQSGPNVLTMRIESCEAAVRVFNYPPELRGWLVEGAQMIHRLVNEQDRVQWAREIPRLRAFPGSVMSEVRYEDVAE